jgi:hypothetical protein
LGEKSSLVILLNGEIMSKKLGEKKPKPELKKKQTLLQN